MVDAFISYSRRNLDFVHELDVALTDCGKTTWFDQKKEPLEGLPPASKWWDEIRYGIEAADNFLLILSPASIASPYCNAEIAHALHHEKRIITVLYCGSISEGETLKAIDQAIDAIPEHDELPPSVTANITNLRSLTRRNWLEVSRIQYVTFSDTGSSEQAVKLLIQGLDTDLAWLRTWSQVRQTAQIWFETKDDSYLWSEMRLKPVREIVDKRKQTLTEIERDFLQPEAERLLAELDSIDTPHTRRSAIGERLCAISDPRHGVGLRPDGVPDIVWCYVPGGTTTIVEERSSSSFRRASEKGEVEQTTHIFPSFYIAKYLITFVQFQAFLDDPDGFECDDWWADLTAKYRKHEMIEQRYKFANHPRDSVSWYQSVAFCRWLNAKLPLEAWPDTATSDMFVATGERRDRLFDKTQDMVQWEIRLPTEWEWQYAATGGNSANEYPWGPEWENGRRCNTAESGLSRTTAVGVYPHGAAPVGALDMSGNVFEFCLNEHRKPANVGIDGEMQRAVRGGSFSGNQFSARCMSRPSDFPVGRSYLIGGFRVVCAPLI